MFLKYFVYSVAVTVVFIDGFFCYVTFYSAIFLT